MYLLTRPLPKLVASVNAFRQAGLDTVGVATSDICPVTEAESALGTQLDETPRPDVIIVTSVFAASALIRQQQARGLSSAHHQVPVIAVGSATAAMLAAVYDQVIIPDIQTSEGILALPLIRSAKCQHIVIIKGEGGRTTLQRSLSDWQRQVNTFCVYRRTTLDVPVIHGTLDFAAVSGIIATSEALGEQLIAHFAHDDIKTTPWLTVSERVATSLRTQGVQDIRVTTGASDSVLIEWIKNNWE